MGPNNVRGTRRWHYLSLVLVLIGSVALLAACSSTTVSKSSKKVSHPTSSKSSALLAAAKAEVKKLEGVPAFTAPNPPFHLKGVAGKTVMVIPFIPIAECKDTDRDIVSVATSKGLHVDVYANNGTPAAWESGVQEAITQHDAGIILVCSDPAPISASLKEAIADHVPVFMTTYADTNTPVPSYLTAVTNVPLHTAMLGIADGIVASQNGVPAHVLFLTSTSVAADPITAPLFVSAFKKACGPKCTLISQNVPASEWTTPQLTSLVSSQLTSHPDITDIFDLYSGMVTETLPAVIGHNIKIWTYAGNVEAPKEVASGKITGDITFNNSWLAYAIMNQVFRVLSGLSPVSNPAPITPVKLLEKSNVEAFLTTPSRGFGSAFVKGYESLWLTH